LRALAGIVTDQAELARAGKLFSPISGSWALPQPTPDMIAIIRIRPRVISYAFAGPNPGN
jgi:hypothetical protein